MISPVPPTTPFAPVKHQPVFGSSSIVSAGYDPQRKVLEIRYHGSGETHAYQNVPYDVHARFLMAKSKGEFAHHVLRKQFASRKIS